MQVRAEFAQDSGELSAPGSERGVEMRTDDGLGGAALVAQLQRALEESRSAGAEVGPIYQRSRGCLGECGLPDLCPNGDATAKTRF